MPKNSIDQRLKCVDIAVRYAPQQKLAKIFSLADDIYDYASRDEEVPARAKKKPVGTTASPQLIDSDPSRESTIAELVGRLPADERIVMRAILARVPTDQLEAAFDEYLPKL